MYSEKDTSSSPLGLLDLATEVLLLIFLELDIPNILSCRQVCKRLNDLYGLSEIQYKCELAFSAMVDGTATGTPVADRLRSLREYQAAWRSGPLSLHPTFSRELSEDSEGTCPQWLSFSGPFSASRAGSKVTLIQLPSSTRRIQEKSWTLDFGATLLVPQCGASNTEQNLTAFAGIEDGNPRVFRCHFFTILPDESSPRAPADLLPISYEVDAEWFNTALELTIRGEAMIWTIICSPGAKVLVYNWRTQELMQCYERPTGFMHAELLTSKLLMISVVDLLLIYAINCNDLSIPPDLDAQYILQPPSNGGLYEMHFRLRMVHDMNGPGTPTAVNFGHDPDAALLVFQLFNRSPAQGAKFGVLPTTYVHCVSRAALLSRLHSSGPAGVDGHNRVLRWEEWATLDNSSLLLGVSSSAQLSLSSLGARFAISFPREDPATSVAHDIYVFDVHRCARSDDNTREARQHATRYFNVSSSQETPNQFIWYSNKPMPYQIVHKTVPMRTGRKGQRENCNVKLLTDGVAFLRETWDSWDSNRPSIAVECYMLSA
ncbi:hypothetical protein GY45DRAFT_1330966 [Cubamyces sp. BRFM 1775]|nr:hypothetical protein GY45DRAFT_1330966 [Cubamyces sp. BRFM 1775]